jgi:Domain of unknown function (DUF4293)
MWQRIQSVFLGIGILSLILGMLSPVWEAVNGETVYRLYPIYFMTKQKGILTGSQYMPFSLSALLMTAAITIAIMEFRQFKNRFLQVKLGTLNSLILAGIMIADIMFVNQLAKTYPVSWRYGYGFYLVFVAVAANWLAIRFIKRDEKLVKDSDRLR